MLGPVTRMTEAGSGTEPERVVTGSEESVIKERISPAKEQLSTKQLSSVVQGTAENLLGKLEDAVTAGGTTTAGEAAAAVDDEEDEVLQDSEPGPLSQDPKEVEEVLNVISQSIYREGQGMLPFTYNLHIQIFTKLVSAFQAKCS